MKLFSITPQITIQDFKVHSRVSYNKTYFTREQFCLLDKFLLENFCRKGLLKLGYWNLLSENEGLVMVKKGYGLSLSLYIYQLYLKGLITHILKKRYEGEAKNGNLP